MLSALVYLGYDIIVKAMCPDILYMIPSGCMNKEYRLICHVYSIGRRLPIGGLGNGPGIKYSREAEFSASVFLTSKRSQ